MSFKTTYNNTFDVRLLMCIQHEPEVNKYHMVELSSLLDPNTIVIETFSVSFDVVMCKL